MASWHCDCNRQPLFPPQTHRAQSYLGRLVRHVEPVARQGKGALQQPRLARRRILEQQRPRKEAVAIAVARPPMVGVAQQRHGLRDAAGAHENNCRRPRGRGKWANVSVAHRPSIGCRAQSRPFQTWKLSAIECSVVFSMDVSGETHLPSPWPHSATWRRRHRRRPSTRQSPTRPLRQSAPCCLPSAHGSCRSRPGQAQQGKEAQEEHALQPKPSGGAKKTWPKSTTLPTLEKRAKIWPFERENGRATLLSSVCT